MHCIQCMHRTYCALYVQPCAVLLLLMEFWTWNIKKWNATNCTHTAKSITWNEAVRAMSANVNFLSYFISYNFGRLDRVMCWMRPFRSSITQTALSFRCSLCVFVVACAYTSRSKLMSFINLCRYSIAHLFTQRVCFFLFSRICTAIMCNIVNKQTKEATARKKFNTQCDWDLFLFLFKVLRAILLALLAWKHTAFIAFIGNNEMHMHRHGRSRQALVKRSLIIVAGIELDLLIFKTKSNSGLFIFLFEK